MRRLLCLLAATVLLLVTSAEALAESIDDRRPDEHRGTRVSQTADREQQRRILARVEKLRSLGEMAGGIVHDLNQNLNLIVGHAQIALRNLDDPSADLARLRNDLHDLLGLIAQSAMEGGQKLGRLQSFIRPLDDTPAERIDLGRLLQEVAHLTSPRWKDMPQAQGRPIELHQKTEGDATIIGWPASLREAFTNLIFNAVDAMPDGGTIWLSVRRQDGQVAAEVTDAGVGMPPEVKARVFEPFFSTKGEQGTGLGLVNVYATVERHDGRIEVDSAPGHGTTFRLSFPAAPQTLTAEPAPSPTPSVAPRPPPPAVARPAESPEQPLRVLVVDDDPRMCRMVYRVLSPKGHEVTEAYTAEEGLDHMARQRYDLVISDLGLGSGMNGWEFAQRVRDDYPDTRFILATGWGNSIDEVRARLFNVAAIVGKPYSIDALVGAVEQTSPRR
ncbi:MAG TPA: ATP-binding protein [Chloroflexota bacterium]|jgi:signal transduction histidine kinase/ActR/RegA family two-component response regulator|nr:ATP-binding protein [Chloroflexota bacterium]